MNERSARSLAAAKKLAYAAILIGLLFLIADRWSFPAIKKFELSGDFAELNAQQLRQLVKRSAAGKNYFTMDLGRLRAQLEALPWVKRTRITLAWPQKVKIDIEEHRRFAILNGSAMVSADGAVFYPSTASLAGGLLSMEAHPESAPRLVRTVKDFRAWASAPELRIVSLKEGGDRTLRLFLDNGWSLIFGRSQWEAKMRRFLKVYPRLKSGAFFHRIDYVDLRHPDGFAIACRGGRPCRL